MSDELLVCRASGLRSSAKSKGLLTQRDKLKFVGHTARAQ